MTTKLAEKVDMLMKKKILTKSEYREIRRITRDPWEDVKGLLSGKHVNSVELQQTLRKEWERN